MNKKKVLIISFEFPPKVGGAGSVGYDYAIFLKNSGYDVTVIALETSIERNFQEFRVLSVKSPRKVQPLFVYFAFLKIYNKSFDAIILNDAGASMLGSLFFNKEMKEKSIVFVHGTEDKKLINNRSFLFTFLKIKKRYFRLLEQCKAVIAVGRHLKSKFIGASGLAFLDNKIEVITNNVSMPPQEISSTEIETLREGFGGGDSIIILTASRLVKGKGYLRMLKLFSQIIEIEPRYKWIIAGEGDFEKDIRDQIVGLNIEKNVKLIGAVDKATLFTYYRTVDLFWMLSEFDEGYPLVYMEAALNGCPVMGNNRGGVREVVNEYTGYLVNEDSEVLDILKRKTFMSLNKTDIEYQAQLMNKDKRGRILSLIEG